MDIMALPAAFPPLTEAGDTERGGDDRVGGTSLPEAGDTERDGDDRVVGSFMALPAESTFA